MIARQAQNLAPALAGTSMVTVQIKKNAPWEKVRYLTEQLQEAKLQVENVPTIAQPNGKIKMKLTMKNEE